MIQFSLYKLELPLNYHDHVLQLSHTKIIKNIVSCILQFLIYYYYINTNADMCALFFTKQQITVRLTQHVTCSH